jgi:hypothetical protein
MELHTFTDANDRAWNVYDSRSCRAEGRAVPLNTWTT